MPNIINFMIRSSCPESYNEFLDSYFFNLRKCLFRIFPDSHFIKLYLRKKQPFSFRKNELSIFISCLR